MISLQFVKDQSDDMALLFDVCFNYDNKRNTTMVKDKVDNVWGSRERNLWILSIRSWWTVRHGSCAECRQCQCRCWLKKTPKNQQQQNNNNILSHFCFLFIKEAHVWSVVLWLLLLLLLLLMLLLLMFFFFLFFFSSYLFIYLFIYFC